MTRRDASRRDMGILPWSSTRGRSHPLGGRARLFSGGPVEDAAPAHDEPAHDSRLAHDEVPHDPELAAGWQAVLAVASAPPRAGELHELERALGHFRTAVPVQAIDARDEGRRRGRSTTLGSRLGVAAAGALLLGFGGVGALALTGSGTQGKTAAVPEAAPTTGVLATPASATRSSGQRTSGDDASDESGDDADESGTPKPAAVPTTATGPDATGPSAHGLCTDWSHTTPAKRTASQSVAFRNLVAAAGGLDQVEAYCASVGRPSAGNAKKPSSHPTGKPSTKPGRGSAHPTGKPSTLPGKPSTLPGKPSTLPGKPSTLPGKPSTGPAPRVTPSARG